MPADTYLKLLHDISWQLSEIFLLVTTSRRECATVKRCVPEVSQSEEMTRDLDTTSIMTCITSSIYRINICTVVLILHCQSKPVWRQFTVWHGCLVWEIIGEEINHQNVNGIEFSLKRISIDVGERLGMLYEVRSSRYHDSKTDSVVSFQITSHLIFVMRWVRVKWSHSKHVTRVIPTSYNHP